MGIHRKLDGGLAAEVERLLEIDGAAIRSARKAAGISQAALAEISGAKQSTIHRIECGETPRSKFFPQVVRALGGYLGEVQRDEDQAAKAKAVSTSASLKDLHARLSHVSGLVQALGMAADSVSDPDVSEPFAAMTIVITSHLNQIAQRVDAMERGLA